MPRKYKKRNYRKKRKRYNNNRQLTYYSAKSIPISSVARRLNSSTYEFVRGIETEQIISSVDAGFTSSSMSFTLQKLVLPGEFTNLFDQYQIVKTETTFQPNIQQINQLVGSNVANAFVVPKIYVVRDLDNTGTISEDVAKERQDVIIKQATEKFTVAMVPQIAMTVFRSGVTSGYSVPYALKWLDCTQNDIPHYGLRYGITASASVGNEVEFSYVIRSRYWVRFRNVR